MRELFLVSLSVLFGKGIQKQRKMARNKKKPSWLARKKTSFAETGRFIPIKIKNGRDKRLAEDKQCILMLWAANSWASLIFCPKFFSMILEENWIGFTIWRQEKKDRRVKGWYMVLVYLALAAGNASSREYYRAKNHIDVRQKEELVLWCPSTGKV